VALSITLGGVDRTNYCDLKSVYITDSIQANADTCDLEVSVSTTDSWIPQAGNEIVIANGTGKEFAGVIEDLYEEALSPTRMRFKLACRDYTFNFDRYLVVDESTAAITASAWVSRIISGFTTGFTGTNVVAGPVIAARQFDYVAPSEAVRSIADAVGYGWYIDYDRDVHFFPAATLPAPIPTLNLETDLTNYGNFKVRESASGVKTRVYLKGYKHKTTAQWNRSFTGDGNTRFFLLGQEPASIDATDMVATVDGAGLTLLTDFVDGSPGTAVGTTADLFVCFDNMGVRTSSGVSAYTSTQTLSATFSYMEDTVSVVEDLAAQAEMGARELNDGIHEYVINDPQLTAADGSDDLANLQGSLALARYAFPRMTGSFESFTAGWRAGQTFDITTTQRLGGFTDTFYVQQVTKRIIGSTGGTPTLKSLVEFSDGVVSL
jgi:hypothetical protein